MLIQTQGTGPNEVHVMMRVNIVSLILVKEREFLFVPVREMLYRQTMSTKSSLTILTQDLSIDNVEIFRV